MAENLSPPFHVFENDVLPPLPQPPGYFDLVYAVSVFTHLTETWTAWLLEVHRLLKPEGLALLTFMGPGIAEIITGQPWDERRTGMLVTSEGQSWDLGGPMVVHSPWWIRAHWGRAFDVLHIEPEGFAAIDGGASQGLVLLRKRDVEVDTAELERIAPEDAFREASALARNLLLVQREVRSLREAERRTPAAPSPSEPVQNVADGDEAQALGAELEALQRRYDVLVSSRSWKLTSPLRGAGKRIRGRLARGQRRD